MSERPTHRRPATFKLDDPHVIVMDPDDEPGRPSRGTVHITPESDPALLPVPVEEPLLPARRGFRWGTLFWTALGGLVLLGPGLGVTNLVEDLFARSEGLGFLGLALAVLAALALVVIVAREALSLARLATIESLHRRAPTRCTATTAPRAARSCRTCSSSRTTIRNWRGRAPRCRATPTTSSTAPT